MTERRRSFVHHEGVYRDRVHGRLLVYLDNNVWIDLVEGRTDEARACRAACEEAVDSGVVLFPLTGAGIEELLDQPKEARPERQADLMDRLSRLVCFRAARHVWDHEARGTVDVYPVRGAVLPDRRRLFTYVIEYISDGQLVFQPEWQSQHIPEFMELVQRSVGNDVGVRWMLDHLPIDEMRARHQDAGRRYVREMQASIDGAAKELRRGGKLSSDRALRHERLWAFREYVQPAVRAEATERYGDRGALDFFREGREVFGDGSAERLGALMLSMPSLDMMCELMAHRTMNPHRRVRREDMLDNEHAMVAPAYCDAFVTNDGNLYDLLSQRC